MAWEAIFYVTVSGRKHVAKFLVDLPTQARAKCAAYIKMLEDHGFSLPRNYLEKVRGELWALRPEYAGNEYRIIFYFDRDSQQFVVLHAIHKTTQRIPEDDINTAEGRMDDWLIRQAGQKEER
jgi:phage-related protein